MKINRIEINLGAIGNNLIPNHIPCQFDIEIYYIDNDGNNRKHTIEDKLTWYELIEIYAKDKFERDLEQ